MAGLYILAPKSRKEMLAFRMDWDSLPEKCLRLEMVAELVVALAEIVVYDRLDAMNKTVDKYPFFASTRIFIITFLPST